MDKYFYILPFTGSGVPEDIFPPAAKILLPDNRSILNPFSLFQISFTIKWQIQNKGRF
jgi:hypothetical protein